METTINEKLNYSVAYDTERVLSYILSRYNKYSRAVEDSDYRVLDCVALSSDDVIALSILHDIFYNKLYD